MDLPGRIGERGTTEAVNSNKTEQISGFVKGIRRDKDAVRKAIELDYNNGLAVGSINKLKVVKRITYGRNSFELLKGKLLRFELRLKIN